jgi:hypothetical protein
MAPNRHPIESEINTFYTGAKHIHELWQYQFFDSVPKLSHGKTGKYFWLIFLRRRMIKRQVGKERGQLLYHGRGAQASASDILVMRNTWYIGMVCVSSCVHFKYRKSRLTQSLLSSNGIKPT